MQVRQKELVMKHHIYLDLSNDEMNQTKFMLRIFFFQI